MNSNEQIKRYGVKIRKDDINPITRVTYLYDAVGMTPAHMDFSRGVFDFGGHLVCEKQLSVYAQI